MEVFRECRDDSICCEIRICTLVYPYNESQLSNPLFSLGHSEPDPIIKSKAQTVSHDQVLINVIIMW